MLSGLFQTTTIPVLEQMVNFAQARHTVLTGNIANLDTPGYQARDLSVEDFQNRLKAAIAQRYQAGGESTADPAADDAPMLAGVAKNSQAIVRHDLGKVDMETQVSEMVKNQVQHNLAITIMTDQFHLLQTAISEKV